MDSYTHHTIQTEPYNLTYSYYLSPNFHASLKPAPAPPVLMFLHGYPDHAGMWDGVISNLHAHSLPNPIILVDILGLGASSKSTTAKHYNYLQQANSLATILRHENALDTANILPIGHDWGSGCAQRFYLYHRHHCVGLTLISLAYQIPSAEPFDLDEQNRLTTQRFGYPQWEYWNFFTAGDAPRIMNENPERLVEINNGVYAGEGGRDVWMREMFCTPGAMREYAEGRWNGGERVGMKGYAKDEGWFRGQVERLRGNGLDAPVYYYHALKDNTMLEDEKLLVPKEKGGKADRDLRRIEVPCLFIGQTGDWVCRTDLMGDAKKEGLVDDVEEKVVDAGHWVMYEKPDEIADNIREWLLKKKFTS